VGMMAIISGEFWTDLARKGRPLVLWAFM